LYRHWKEDVVKYTVEGDYIMCDGKIILCRDGWESSIESIITMEISKGLTSTKAILTSIKAKYYVGKFRNAANTAWVESKIKDFNEAAPISVSNIINLDTCMPTTADQSSQFKGTYQEISGFLAYLSYTFGFEIRRCNTYFSKSEKTVSHYYNCNSRRTRKKNVEEESTESVSSDDEQDESGISYSEDDTVSAGSVKFVTC